MTIYEYLQRRPEEIPAWLDQFREGDGLSHEQFFDSRVVYYPGAGTDGHPVKVFGSTHSAHSFVYADFGVAQGSLEAELGHPRNGFRGYHTLSRLTLAERDLVPGGWAEHTLPGETRPDMYWAATVVAAPFGFLEVLERDQNLDDTYGARRLAILFLGADGIAAYDALFCQKQRHPSPFAVVLQDHGFSGNYNSFGGGGLLEAIARRCDVAPQWLLVADNTEPWEGFRPVFGVESDPGGMHSHERALYERASRSNRIQRGD